MTTEAGHPLGYAWIDLNRQERMVGYLALKQKGKQKGADLELAVAVRQALLDECEIDEATGAVTWVSGTVILRTAKEFACLKKAVDKLHDDEGVDIDLGEALIALVRILDAKAAELKAEAATPRG